MAAPDLGTREQAAPADGATLLVEKMTIEIRQRRGSFAAVQDVSFAVDTGEILCIVGESGCGKTLTSLSIMRLLPPAARLAGGRVSLAGEDLGALGDREMRQRRGRDVSMIFQEPMTALDPSFRIGHQLIETVRAHEPVSRAAARERAAEMLDLVGIPDGRRRLDDYPHQFSGGMRQRIVIAMALILRPKLLIADEPTTALDVTIQAQILDLIRGLRDELGMSVLFITHNLGVVHEIADRVAVMYAGELVETGPVSQVFAQPLHPYTQGLLRSMPSLTPPGRRLPVIAGRVPDIRAMPAACRFAPRCPNRADRCDDVHPPLEPTVEHHELRCYHPTPLGR